MRHLTLFITFCLLLWLASSSPIDKERRLINRPSQEEIFSLRNRRYAYGNGVKTRPRSSFPREQPLELSVKKGEYVCGNRVCKLKPGEIPRGCNGICQYPIL